MAMGGCGRLKRSGGNVDAAKTDDGFVPLMMHINICPFIRRREAIFSLDSVSWSLLYEMQISA